MRPSSVYAERSCPAGDPCDLLGLLHGPHRVGCRLVMILLSQHGSSAAQIASVLGCDPSTVRRGIHRYHQHGVRALAARGLASASCGCSLSPGVDDCPAVAAAGPSRHVAADPPPAGARGRQLAAAAAGRQGRPRPRAGPDRAAPAGGALKAFLASSPTLTIQGRIRQVHAFFGQRSPHPAAGHRRGVQRTMAARELHAEPQADRLASPWTSVRRRPVEAVTGDGPWR
jgi:hypothetical protein